MIRRISLQTRVLALLVLLLAILWTTLLVDAQRGAKDIAAREVDARLHGMSDFLLTLSEWPALGRSDIEDILTAAGRPFEVDRLGSPVYELSRGGVVLLRSEGFPTFRSRPEPGLQTAVGSGGTWTVLTIVDARDDITRRTALRRMAQEERADDLKSERTASLNLLLPLFGIGVLASIWLGLRPLRAIRQRITDIDPNEPAQLGVDGGRMPREIADLAEAFDALVAKLARVMTGQRIFAAVASHELRTPLAGAISQLDVLKRDPASRAARQRLTESLRYMDRLVSQLLALARDEASVSAKGPSVFDIIALVRDLRDELTRDEPTLQIDVVAPGASVTMTGYPDLVLALLRNLIQNALAASGNLPVSIVIEAPGEEVQVVVMDHGPGFPAEQRHASFDPFVRRVSAKKGSGTGLGLAVVQRIAELHQGKIEIASRLGGGAEVTVALPRRFRAAKE